MEAGTNVGYVWAFGDGGTGSGAVVPHSYPAAGNHTAVVTASNSVSAITATTGVTVAAPALGLVTRTITYDPLSGLTGAEYSAGESYAYRYEAAGNRVSMTDTAGAHTYAYNAANRLTSVDGVTYAWDARRNLTSDGLLAYTCNAAGRMVRAESVIATLVYPQRRGGPARGATGGQRGDELRLRLGDRGAGNAARVQYPLLMGYETLGECDSGAWQYHLPDGLARCGRRGTGRVRCWRPGSGRRTGWSFTACRRGRDTSASGGTRPRACLTCGRGGMRLVLACSIT